MARKSSTRRIWPPVAVAKFAEIEHDGVGRLLFDPLNQLGLRLAEQKLHLRRFSACGQNPLRARSARSWSYADTPAITRMRRASGCSRRARSRVPPTSSRETTPVTRSGRAAFSSARAGIPWNTTQAPGHSSLRCSIAKSSAGCVTATTTSMRSPLYFLTSRARYSGSYCFQSKRCASSSSEKYTKRRVVSLASVSRIAASITKYAGR